MEHVTKETHGDKIKSEILEEKKYHENESYDKEKGRGHEEMKVAVTKTVVLNEGPAEKLHAIVQKYFNDSFWLDESLYDNIPDKYLWSRGDPLRHPVCWYMAHTAAFYINKLRLAHLVDGPLNATFESRFAVGVDEMSWDDKLEDRDDWPSPKEIRDYRSQVRKTVNEVIEKLDMVVPITWNSPWWCILMGIEHSRIHLETSSVLIRQVPIERVQAKGIWANECKSGIFSDKPWKPELGAVGHAPLNKLLPVQGKQISYGRQIDADTPLPVYGWDNEFGKMTVDVPSFKASKFLVSNEEYYEFVLNKGYETEEYWTEEGWRWVTTTKSTHPKFWIPQSNGGWKLRTVVSVIPLPWNWPVVCNNLEAHAFCKWKAKISSRSIRLPTEDEYQVLRSLGTIGSTDQPFWKKAPGNVNLEYFASECPVDMFPCPDSGGFFDIIGNVWQHTITPQHPFNDFVVHKWYEDFTVPCFGPHHSMIKGGSWISTGNEAIALSRYQFRRHFFQHAGIRYVDDTDDNNINDKQCIVGRDLSYLIKLADSSTYTNKKADRCAHFHYWDEKYLGVPNLLTSVAQIALTNSDPRMRKRALDANCGAGRLSFELAKSFDHVTGVDASTRTIGMGYRLQEQGFLEWQIPQEGEIMKKFRVTIDELGYKNSLKKVVLVQNDVQNMDPEHKDFDLVVATNLLDQLNDPSLFLTNIQERINKGGTLVLLSSYSWIAKITPKHKWIGGKYDEKGQPLRTAEVLKNLLKDVFVLVKETDVPFVFCKSMRVHEYSLLHCTIWRKK